MDSRTFCKYRDFIYEKSGINLNYGKEALVSSRISKRMRALQIREHAEYLRYVLEDPSGEELVMLIDAISTNVTSFFRESRHFDLAQHYLAKWLAAGQSRFRFWSAACSSGEEPYSLAMAIQETPGRAGADIKVLATDISTRMLQKADAGCYRHDRLDSIPKYLRTRYFDTKREKGEVRHSVGEELRQMIVFRRLNLSQPPFPMKGPFDIIFCRNVMIYFDNSTRGPLLKEIHRLLKPGGLLMVGHAESLTGLLSPFKSLEPSVYVKV